MQHVELGVLLAGHHTCMQTANVSGISTFLFAACLTALFGDGLLGNLPTRLLSLVDGWESGCLVLASVQLTKPQAAAARKLPNVAGDGVQLKPHKQLTIGQLVATKALARKLEKGCKLT